MRNLTAFAIGIGSINPKCGQTKFGWNIYDNGTAFYICGNNDRLLYATKGSFEIGDVVIFNNIIIFCKTNGSKT